MADTTQNLVNPLIANNLTDQGYIKRTAEQWQQILINAMQAQNPNFSLNPADLQSDLINTSIQKIMQFEELTSLMLNAYSTGFNNNLIFKAFAESIGLCKNQASLSSVNLSFIGPAYTFIPQGTICSDTSTTIQVSTTSAITLDSTGKGSISAVSSESLIIEANLINTIQNLNIEGLSVNNEEAGITGLPQESDEDLKLRTQAMFRSPRKGGLNYVYSLLQNNLNVNPRLIKIEVVDNYLFNTSSTSQAGRAIHAIVGGGADNDVANALFLGILETQKLVSMPSNNETNRTKNITINYYNSKIQVCYTIPKELNIVVNVYLLLKEYNYSPSLIYGFINEAIINYINNLNVGEQLNKLTLTGLILPLLNNQGIKNEEVLYLDYTFTLNGEVAATDSSGFIQGIYNDTYLTITNLNVYLSQIHNSSTTQTSQELENAK